MAKNILNASALNNEVKTEVKTPAIIDVTSFGDYVGKIDALKDAGYKVLRYKVTAFDEILGIEFEGSKSVLVANKELFLKSYIGKRCQVEVVVSPKLGIEVVKAISVVREEGGEQ